MRAKKYVVIYAVAVFLIIFLITFNSVCAITQFDVKYNVGSADMTRAAQRVQNTLESRYLRKSYLFFKDSDIREVVADEGGGYLEITDISRTFPNKISVTVREKFENYAFVAEGQDADGNLVYTYYAVGDDGTVLAVSSENKNNITERQNIEIAGFEFPAVQVGEKFAVSEGFEDAYSALQTCFSVISEKGLRGNILRIEYDGFFDLPDPSRWLAQFIIDCKEGVQIIIPDPQISTQEKAEKAFAEYLSLDEVGDIGRMEGRIEVRTSASGEITAVYSPSESPAAETDA